MFFGSDAGFFREKPRWFLIYSWKFSFSALFRDIQVMNSAVLELKYFSIRPDQRWLSLRRQPGIWLTVKINPLKGLKWFITGACFNWQAVKNTNSSWWCLLFACIPTHIGRWDNRWSERVPFFQLIPLINTLFTTSDFCTCRNLLPGNFYVSSTTINFIFSKTNSPDGVLFLQHSRLYCCEISIWISFLLLHKHTETAWSLLWISTSDSERRG